MEMKRIARGKNILYAGYDPVAGILAVQFAKSGVYKFTEFPEAKWVSLQRSPFPDRFFSTSIKGKYPVIKPEKVSNGNTQDTQRRDSDSGNAGVRGMDAGSDRNVLGNGSTVLPDGRRNAKGTGGRVVEFFRQEDGLTFEPEGHIYKLDGKRVISLTQILDAAGLVDYSGIAPEVLANKAKFGTKVHEYCLWLDQNELDMDDLKPYPTYWNRVEGWRQFAEDFNFVCDMKWCEVPCAVKVNGMTFAMTVDRFGFTGPAADPVPTIVEIKTCADREFHHQVQTAAQTIPFRGDGSVPVKRGAVYLLDKPNASKKLYFYQPHEDRMDEKIFMAALILTQTRINHKLLKGY